MNIFYSWQSDLPSKKNRSYIKSCLDKASSKSQIKFKIDEATRNEPGTPDIAEIIFRKIDSAEIFLCDVSIINSSIFFRKRKTPNPNVLIELGYASKALGWDNIICVFNTQYGKIEDLPFDIKSRRILPYSSEKEKNDLVSALATAIKTIKNSNTIFTLTPSEFEYKTGIYVKLGDHIKGMLDLSNPFHIDTTENFPWMEEFISRYKNNGKWIGDKRFISPSGMKTFDDRGNIIHYEYPDSVFKSWGAISLQIDQKEYRIESLSFMNSLINTPQDNEMKPLLIENSGEIIIKINRHPYIEAVKGQIKVEIEKSK